MPRRRRASVAAVESGRGLALRVLLHSPKDTLAGLLAFAACSAIIANALFLQTGQHPAPMFGTPVNFGASSPLPRPRPAGAEVATPEPRLAEPRQAEPRLIEPRGNDPMGNLVKATTSSPLSS